MENKPRSPENGKKKNAWTCPRVLHYLSRIVGLCHNRAEFTGFRFKHKRLFENIAVSTDYVFLELLYKTVQLVRVDHVHSDQICVFLNVCFCPAKAFMNAFLVINVPCHVPRAKGRVSDLRPARLFLACRYWQNEYYCHVLGAGHWTHGHHFLLTPVKPVKEWYFLIPYIIWLYSSMT